MFFNLFLIHKDESRSEPIVIEAPGSSEVGSAAQRAVRGNGDFPKCEKGCDFRYGHHYEIKPLAPTSKTTAYFFVDENGWLKRKAPIPASKPRKPEFSLPKDW